MKLKKILDSMASIGKGATDVGKLLLSAFNPKKQIEVLGGRRVWLSLVTTILAMAFTILAHSWDIPDNIVLAVLGLGGLGTGTFIAGESARDAAAAKKE